MRGEVVPIERRPATDDFVAFYRAEYPGAVRLVLALTQWRDGSEDIVQDSFAKVQPRFADLERPGGYLRVTVVNQCREAERRRRREQRRLGRLTPAGPAGSTRSSRRCSRRRRRSASRHWLTTVTRR